MSRYSDGGIGSTSNQDPPYGGSSSTGGRYSDEPVETAPSSQPASKPKKKIDIKIKEKSAPRSAPVPQSKPAPQVSEPEPDLLGGGGDLFNDPAPTFPSADASVAQAPGFAQQPTFDAFPNSGNGDPGFGECSSFLCSRAFPLLLAGTKEEHEAELRRLLPECRHILA